MPGITVSKGGDLGINIQVKYRETLSEMTPRGPGGGGGLLEPVRPEDPSVRPAWPTPQQGDRARLLMG